MADRADLEFTYSLIDRIFRLSLGEEAVRRRAGDRLRRARLPHREPTVSAAVKFRGRLADDGDMGLRPLARFRVATACVLFASLTLAAPAAAHDSAPEISTDTEKVLGGEISTTKDDLLRVRTEEGARFLTHGPDFPQSRQDPLTDHGGDIGPGDPERAPVCATNPATDYHQEALYAYPSSGTNDVAAERTSIRGIIRRMNHVLDEESRASGGPNADYIVRCETGSSEIRVSAFPVPSPDSQATFSEIVDAAKAAGFTNPRVDYSMFYDGPGNAGACGVGFLYDDDRLISDNANNNSSGSAGYAATFDSCWYGRTPMHENGHNQGAVQSAAPSSTGSGAHCNQRDDVMCYSPDGGNLLQGGMVNCPTAPGTLHFDCGWDTYFDAAPEPGEWLATNWNIGSPLNRFIRFTSGGNQLPTANFSFTCANPNCNFADQSSDSDGTIASQTWSWGDGTPDGSGSNPTHAYATAGTRNVTLTVTDNSGATSSITKSVSTTVPPSNDDLASATQLVGVAPPAVSGTNAGATKQSGEPSHAGNAGGRSVWYRWTAPSSGAVAVNTCGADFDTLLGVYTGSTVGALTTVASDDDAPEVCGTGSLQSAVTFSAVADTTYRIAVDGFRQSTSGATAQSGNVRLTLSGPAAAPNQPPIAEFTSSCAQLACSFTSNGGDADGSITSHSWSFGEGGTGQGAGVTYSYRATGSYPVTSTVTDEDGATDSVTQVVTVTAPGGSGPVAADTTPPQTTIVTAARKLRGKTASFEFTASEPVSFRCALDRGSATPCSSPAKLTRLKRGRHVLTVTAVDRAGNADPTPAEHRFRVVEKKR